MSGNRLPVPIPARVRPHSSLAQIPRTLRGGSPEHARQAPVTQWLLPRTGGLHSIHLPRPSGTRKTGVSTPPGGPPYRWPPVPYSDRRIEHALNPVSRTAAGSTVGSTPCPDPAPHPENAPRRRSGPPVTARATWSAGPPSAVSWFRWCCSGAAPRRPAPSAPPWAWRPSPRSAGRCCASPSAARPGCAPRSGPRTAAATSGPGREPTGAAGIRGDREGRGDQEGREVRAGREGPEDREDRGERHRSTDRFPCTRPYLFSQLLELAHPPPPHPPNPRLTCKKRVSGPLRTLRGLATATRRTSLRAVGVQRFVIECFTPSCHVDNVPGVELVTAARPDTVDSILMSYGGGLVQDRGETCRSDTTEEPRPPRGA